ncbi:Hypothetical protein CINCED_3A000649 [Cinara cedri]|uniref:Nucleolar, Nop52 n=1 Tax=Cinara cedri TaxID=506608 RepID=A0A5E4MRK5_9HEMI|nr:Hypothetical protein CINCED_3A000649 [Cinara cedri]
MATDTSEDKVNLVAREIELTKLLASNDPKIRSEGIKQIKQLLLNNSGDSEDAFQLNDYLIIWRGLFYFMWMADKLLPQESATEKISNLFHSCTSHKGKLLFLEAFFLTIKDDWMSISQHRIDKFMMLVRRCLRQVLFTFVNCDWNREYLEKFSEVLYNALTLFTLSLRSHLQEIFLEELAKVSKGRVPSEALVIILDAFLHYISELNDTMTIKEVTQNVFRNLLSQSPDMEILEEKFLAWHKMGKPGKSYNDLELVEADIVDDNSNEQTNSPLDPRAGNVSVEIPRIKFNPKDIAKLLNKYVTEVDCTRKCLVEITKLLKWYNRLGLGILPYKPKDLKLNSRKKKKTLSKMVKEGVKKLEMVDSQIKKSSRQVVENRKSLRELEKMGEVIVEHGKIGKSIWKVRKFEQSNSLKENFSLNGSWTVSEENKNNDIDKSVCVTDDEPPLLVPIGFNVDILEKTPIQQKVSTPNLKSLIGSSSKKENNSKKLKSPMFKVSDVSVTPKNNNIKKSNSPSVQNVLPNSTHKSPNVNTSHNTSWSVSVNNDESISKKVKKSENLSKTTPKTDTDNIQYANKNNTPDEQNKIPIGSLNTAIKKKLHNQDSVIENQKNLSGDFVMSKIKRRSNEIDKNSSLNESWSVCNNEKINLSAQKQQTGELGNNNIKKVNLSNITDEVLTVVNTSHRNSWSLSDDINESASKKVKLNNESIKDEDNNISILSMATPDKISKSPKSPKSPTPEQRVLRRRTIIIPKKKLEVQNGGTPKNNVKTKLVQNRRKTLAGEEIGLLKPEEISNKALEKVRSNAYENDFSSPRKSSRLSIKTDSAKKRVEFKLKNNVAQGIVLNY